MKSELSLRRYSTRSLLFVVVDNEPVLHTRIDCCLAGTPHEGFVPPVLHTGSILLMLLLFLLLLPRRYSTRGLCSAGTPHGTSSLLDAPMPMRQCQCAGTPHAWTCCCYLLSHCSRVSYILRLTVSGSPAINFIMLELMASTLRVLQ